MRVSWSCVQSPGNTSELLVPWGTEKRRRQDNIEKNEILTVLAFCLDDFLESTVTQKCISRSISLSQWECE